MAQADRRLESESPRTRISGAEGSSGEPSRRESSIDIHFPGLESALAPWRNPTVAVATKGVPPHVSLLYPWREPPLSGHDLDTLQHAVALCPVFSICFVRVGHFASNVLFLEPAPDAALRNLMHRIWAAFPDSPPYAGAFRDPAPHLTIAKATTHAHFERLQSEIHAAMAALLPLTLLVEEIVVMEEGVTGFWQSQATMRLRRDDAAKREG
jgi:hypothetical protein